MVSITRLYPELSSICTCGKNARDCEEFMSKFIQYLRSNTVKDGYTQAMKEAHE